MQPINWQQFGLKKDPFDTSALIEGGDLPIGKAFVGRDQEMSFLDSLFESSDRLCLTICGSVGVGKTSLVNFHKFIWKYEKMKLLFSFRREIEASKELLNKRSFLIEIIGSVLRGYFGLTQDYVPLKWLLEAQKDLSEKLKSQRLEQMELF